MTMRNDSVARLLDARRNIQPVQMLAAEDMYRLSFPPVPGGTVARTYGLLIIYVSSQALPLIVQNQAVGRPGYGCWLTPTPYASCLAPYDLGLPSPRDFCLLVDVAGIAALWGPGTAPPSRTYPMLWKGGAVEFFAPNPIPIGTIRGAIQIMPCGDTH
jgi:hypothetical protein